MFKLVSKYKPSGDQPEAIKELVQGIKEGKKEQVLLGATGTGKTCSACWRRFAGATSPARSCLPRRTSNTAPRHSSRFRSP